MTRSQSVPRARLRNLGVVVALAVMAGGGALVGANFIKSPADLAADAEPPPSGPVTAPVEQRVMRTTMVMRGVVEPESSFKVAAPTPRNAAKPVVTRLGGDLGAMVTAGQVLAEVSGRPVIALPGATPAFRDITPGANGDDIAQLQDALRSKGYRINDPKGEYGVATKIAVAALYRDAGYEAQPTSDDEDQQLKVARRQVRDLQRAHDAAPPGSKELTLQSLADAQEDLADLEARTGPMVPVGEIAFVPTLPARIASKAAQLGDQVTDGLMTLAGGQLVVRAPVDERKVQLVRAGFPVEIVSELVGMTATGTVAAVDVADRSAAVSADESAPATAAPDGPGNVGGEHVDARPTVTVHPEQPLADELAGQNVRLTIVSASTESAVLVVPLAAVSARAGGEAVVIRVVDGREEQVVISPGVSGSGYVEVKPTEGGLNRGDRVVIGR